MMVKDERDEPTGEEIWDLMAEERDRVISENSSCWTVLLVLLVVGVLLGFVVPAVVCWGL